MLGQASLIGDRNAAFPCSPQPSDGGQARTYNYISEDATLLDVRATYNRAFGNVNAAAGLHIGRISERRSPYAGLNVSARYGFLGIGADYTLHQVKYIEAAGPPTPDAWTGAEYVSGWFIRIFAETGR